MRGTITVEYTLARLGAERLWNLLHTEAYVPALGALTGNQAVQQVQAGLKAIYVSGWQVAGDANLSGQMYPDQSLYPANSVPSLVRAINNAFMRADQIHCAEGAAGPYWFAPIIADAEAGFGGTLNAFELMKSMIEAGAAAVHFEDQLSSAKKCGHLGGKVVVPTREFVQKLIAARLAADVLGVPTLLIARTDANSAKLLLSDVDPTDHPFIEPGRTSEGFFQYRGGLEAAIARGLAYAPYADLIWCETSEPDMEEARRFAEAIHAKYPGKLLAYNCSPSFHWKKKLKDSEIAAFQKALAGDGLQIPVRYPGGLPRAEPHHVRAGAQLRAYRHDRLCGFAGERIRVVSRGRLFRREASALCRHRIFRCRAEYYRRRGQQHRGARRVHRNRAVLLRGTRRRR